MVQKTSNNSLVAKLGTAVGKALQEHAGDEIDVRGQRRELPGGISGGVARLTKCYFKQFAEGKRNAGEWFYRAEAEVLEPEEYKGYITSVMEPLCDTETQEGKVTTKADHAINAQSHMRKLGADTTETDEEDLEPMAEELQESEPVFEFSTSLGKATERYPIPRVFQNWHGVIEDYQELESDDIDGDSGEDEETTESKTKEIEQDVPFGDSSDDLVAIASEEGHKNQEESQNKLQELAVAAGNTTKDVEEAADWADVAEMGRKEDSESKTKSNDGDERETEEEFTPEKGETYLYKGEEHVVQSVFPGKRTVSLKTPDGTLKKGVSWDDLKQE